MITKHAIKVFEEFVEMRRKHLRDLANQNKAGLWTHGNLFLDLQADLKAYEECLKTLKEKAKEERVKLLEDIEYTPTESTLF